MQNWLQVNNAAAASQPVEVLLYGFIGRSYDDRGVSAKAFAQAIGEIPSDREIMVRIHSPGGSIFDGLAMHTTLEARKSRVTTKIDGLAASMASVIAMAGKKVIIPANAMMMIHNPSGLVIGGAADMRRTADELDKFKSSLVNIYASKTKKSAKDIEAAMDRTTWYTGSEAVQHGFADENTPALALAACLDPSCFHAPSSSFAASGIAEKFLELRDDESRNAMFTAYRGALMDPNSGAYSANAQERRRQLGRIMDHLPTQDRTAFYSEHSELILG